MPDLEPSWEMHKDESLGPKHNLGGIYALDLVLGVSFSQAGAVAPCTNNQM